MATEGPWDVAIETNTRQLAATLDELPEPVAEDARRLGFSTLWVEPVGSERPPARGVLVLWRSHPGRPTPNELNAVHQGAAIVSLAWERHESES